MDHAVIGPKGQDKMGRGGGIGGVRETGRSMGRWDGWALGQGFLFNHFGCM